MGVRRKAKDSERLLGKTKKKKIKEDAALGKSVDAHKSIFEIEKRPSTQKGKDVERLLFKNKTRKKKMNRASDESAEVFESPCDIEKGCKIQKGMDVEWLSVKTKKRKIKEHKTSDQSIGAGEPPEFEKGSKTLKAKDSERLLGKTKKRKIQENAALGKSIDAHKSISEIEKRPSTQKGKDAERLLFKNKKRKKKMNRASDESAEVFESPCDIEKGCKIQKGMDVEWLSVKTKKRKIKEHKTSDQSIGAGESPSEFEKGSKTLKGRRSEKIDSLESSIHSEALNETDSFIEPEVTANESKTRARKFKKNCKHKKKQLTKVQEINIEEIQRVVDEEKVDEISLVGDDCTKGMKKWLIQYKESRPGLKVLQQRIDEFVTAHEERQEQERTEREARAAEDGWTVVVHQKGRKKTTDAETGTAMGSVASAAVMDMMSKKKSKEITLDFYRFQKREAKRNEVMMLQRKFEQDKKRIQQLRAARKFRPS